jgi:hypothetical protein
MSEKWARLEPVCEPNGSRYAWALVVSFDPDWQEYSLVNNVFRVEIPDDYVDGLKELD